jgi:hypothetical protein
MGEQTATALTASRRLGGMSLAGLEAEHTRLSVDQKRLDERLVRARQEFFALKTQRPPAAPRRLDTASEAWNRLKREKLAVEVQLSVLRPVLRAARVASHTRRSLSRAEHFVTIAAARLAPEVYAMLWSAVDAESAAANGARDEQRD